MSEVEPYNPSSFPVLISLSIAVAITIVIVIATTLKLLKKRSRIALAFSLGIYFAAISVIIAFLGQLDWFLTQYYPHVAYLYVYMGPIGYTCVGLTMLCLVWFSIMVFNWKRKHLWISIVIVVIMLIIVYHPYNWWGQAAPEGEVNLRPLTQVMVLLYSGITLTRIGINALSAAKLASSDVIRKNFLDIGRAMFIILCGFLLFLLDAVVSIVFRWPYNIVAWVSWWAFIIGLYFLYRGFYWRKLE